MSFPDSEQDAMHSSSVISVLHSQNSSVSNSKRNRREETRPESDDEEPFVNIDNFTGPFTVWVENSTVQDEIRRIFRLFVKTFKRENAPMRSEPFYMARLRQMARVNGSSLEVDYNDIGKTVQNIAIWLADYPSKILPLLDKAVFEVTEAVFPGYRRIRNEINVRISGLPIEDCLRELRQLHLGRLVRVFGVVTKRTSVFPQLKTVQFNCVKCNYLSLPYTHASHDKELKPPKNCRECGSKGPFRVNQQKTIYRNFQRITLQESPGSVTAGRVPRSKEIILTDDLIDSVRPGEEIGLTGIYKSQFEISLNSKNGFPVFATVIEANHVQRLRQQIETNLTDEDKKLIRKFASKPNICEIISNSIAPSIHGHREIKEALAMALFGGTLKEIDKGRHRLRGDINVLILGDPGTAKSQFLKYIEKAAPRAVYSTGKGASAVGLTASVQKDPKTREWVLEGGALVLADQGVCLIDEFDKMRENDRTSIHEAMEQQTISISKAGIVATLQARCSVVAVANPRKERYDSSASFDQNVDLSDTILSRFDIICVVKDSVDPLEDERKAKFVVQSHVRSHPTRSGNDEQGEEDTQKETMPQELLRKYISFARNSIKPRLSNINQHKIIKVYAELRKESMREGAIPIGVRHIESIIRMAEARSKMRLHDYVSNGDVDSAIKTAVSSFVGTQKFSVMRAMRRRFKRFLHSSTDFHQLLMHVLGEMMRDEQQYRSFMAERRKEGWNGVLEVPKTEFELRAKQLEVFDVQPFYNSTAFKTMFKIDFEKNLILKK